MQYRSRLDVTELVGDALPGLQLHGCLCDYPKYCPNP